MDWFGRARKLVHGLGPAEPPAPQSYRVTCPDGHVVRGQRTEGYQAIRCPGCGEGLFVLPRSPLPDPPAPANERPRIRAAQPEPLDDEPIQWIEGPTQFAEPESEPEHEPVSVSEPDRAGAGFEMDIQWEEEVAEQPVAPARPAPAARRAAASASASATTTVRSEAVPTPRKPRESRPSVERERERAEPRPLMEVPPGPSFGQRVHRYRHRLTVLGVLLFVVATIGFRMHQRYWENLPKLAEVSRTEGLDALRSGIFDVAKQRLAVAASALEALGDPEAAQVRQAANEAAIFADLANLSLEEIIEQMAIRDINGQQWFQSRHQGRSVLIDARMAVSPGMRTLDYRIFSGGKRGWIDLRDLDLLRDRPDDEPVTFGARLARVTLESDGQWRVAFAPDSGVYLSTDEGWAALGTLGWPDKNIPLEDLP